MHKGKGMKFVGDSRISAERKPNVPKDYSEYPGRTEAFWPNFLLKEWLAGAVFLVGFLCLTLAHPSPLEGVADPTDAAYIPLPDWYFLFLYELLKYEFASGDWTLMGIIVLPGIAFGALLLAPFLDKGPGRRPHQRPIAVGMMLLALASVIWLTYTSAAVVDWEGRAEANKPVPESEVSIDTEHPGYAAYENSCLSCHGGELEGGAGPALVGIDYSKEEIMTIATDGIGSMPADQFQGSEEELDQLAEFIISVNEEAE
ncbi:MULTISPECIES: menaquinol-cytochrome c reductase cytochrome b/c subunit [Oceanobacillus]|uniref:Menaquinol:cytochrome c reductase cytochrome c subunit n=1 Tax=Oceanobacillus kimchii TaxID=746691 RepID=A0ABQ5THS9_9BACI|nr:MULTISPECIES: menaquinol-cytochrome c reductase cytochrome b/c subunit [Oceanobacillus]MBT2598474.1 c-type cytochrome [Oceanobacillus sp. ISL-74]MBT2651392.1 c-type cytochrome [Oceanobacillus sp. ISL-73]MCT1576051.1 c-type cytochrome [Oceanobacillus kimchii]MCT2135688.1 c-type cytochrome [Oceanobacillus kimchii]OEH55784.1 cytochrome C oxidase Cbb3 [Oceanobacillus sp. E9]